MTESATYATRRIGLVNLLVLALMERHPLPWRIEQDWTWEVLDVKGRLVLKCSTPDEAEELVACAVQLAALDAKGKIEVAALLKG